MHDVETAKPMTQRRWLSFAMERDGRFQDFFGSTSQVRMCGDDPIVLVRLVVDEDGPYWGWYYSQHPHNDASSRGHVAMIYSHREAVAMCFPYGPKADIALGHGQIVRLRAERIRAAVHPETIQEETSEA